ncbi:Ig domain-containing protein [Spirosoma arcticum]
MKNHCVHGIQRVWLVLLWAGLISQTGRAQSVPDSQFARLGTTLAITTDGGIVTTRLVTEPNPFNGPSRTGSTVSKYSTQGDLIWSTGPIQGGNYIGGQIQGYNYEVIQVSHIAALSDGGVAVVGRTSLRNVNVVTKISAAGVARRWSDSDGVGFSGGFDDLIGTPDGGFLLLATNASNGGKTTVSIRKYNADVSVAWTREIAYPTPNPTTPDQSLTKGKSVINTPDGGYLIAGYFNASGNSGGEAGWVAKLDGQGNVAWQKLLNGLPLSMNINGPPPGSIIQMRSVTDVIVAADGNGYALVGTAIGPSAMAVGPTRGAILELNLDGSFKRARSTGEPPTESFITTYTGSGVKKYYAVGNSSLQNGVDPQILLIDPASLPLSDPALFNVAARRTFNGPDDGNLVAIGVAGDGGLVFASTGNQVVKLLPQIIALIEPTYSCQTGAITFNTIGGDGSTITYNAPGIIRSSASSNTGTVEQGLRNDPKIIPITATQNGISATYDFDLKAACSSIPGTKPPVSYPIPSQSYTVGQSVELLLSPYIFDPTSTSPNYNPGWVFNVEGLPDGLRLDYGFFPFGVPNIRILGNPRTAGLYTVTITASTAGYRDYPIRTTFTITVTPNGQPPVTPPPVNPPTPPVTPPGSLALTQPTYNCQSGAITFNTTGGDGSPITYNAPGVSRSSATSNSGTVEPGLRGDPKPLTITATQSGQTASYTFDFGAFCTGTPPPVTPPVNPPTPPPGGTLTLLPPTYDCASGAFTFRTSGGNGSTIEYMAIGITGWTSNPNQFVDRDSRTANDVKPFSLMARQNGVVVSYEWDLKAACGRTQARLGVAGEREATLSVLVLGNPVRDAVTVEIRGAEGQPLVLGLVDLRGRLVESRSVEQAGVVEQQRFELPQQGPGVLLLRATSGTQTKTVKILKQ